MRSFSEIEDAMGQLLGLESAVRAQVLSLLPEIDTDDEPWRVDGAHSLAPWLVARFGLSTRTARELVDVSRRLVSMPDLAAAFAEGRLSWDQLRAAAHAGTGAEQAVGMSAAQLEREARLRRTATERDAFTARGRRSVRFWNDHVNGVVRMSGTFDVSDGEIVRAAVTRLAEQAPKNPDTGMYDPFESRCADALVELCSATIADDADADRATVVFHVTDRGCETASGTVVALETQRRRSCDCRWHTLRLDGAGRPVGIGRVSQSVPPWIRRIVEHRDGGRCRFPGCERRRLVEVHHLWHWEDGGPTELDNLACLCSYHHHLAHEGGWRIAGDPAGSLTWIRPDGRELESGPPALRPDVQQRLADWRRAS
jgi:hypothetical protein